VLKFTAKEKDELPGTDKAVVLVCTYNMLVSGRAAAATRMIRQIQDRTWGLLLMDEVHVVPAKTFQKV
jgi:DNA excision repair protein ERCC-3